jgi:hypothetical protein
VAWRAQQVDNLNQEEKHHEQRSKQQEEFKKRTDKNLAGKKDSQKRKEKRKDEPGTPQSNRKSVNGFHRSAYHGRSRHD